MGGNVWTLEEDKIIRDYYPVEGSSCRSRLPGRTVAACVSRAQFLKIKYDKNARILPDGTISVRTRNNIIQLKPNMEFGYLKLIEPVDGSFNRDIHWKCQCICGKIVNVSQGNLRKGKVKSCGCKSWQLRREYLESSKGQQWREQIKREVKYYTGRVKGTHATLLLSSRPNTLNTSGVKGVCWNKAKNKFIAYITFRKNTYHLGYFDNLEDAAKVRKIAEEKLAPLLHDILDECKEEIVKMRMKDLKKELKNNSK